MTITIPRFEAKTIEKGIKFTIDGNQVVIIQDHKTDKIIGMINLTKQPNNNLELAQQIITTIETWITENEEN